MDFLEYSEALKEDKGDLTSGRLKLTGTQVIFKNHKTGKVDILNCNEIQRVVWQRMAGEFSLRIIMKNGQLYRYGGFKESEKDKMSKFISKNYSLELESQEFSLKGWNWGTASFEGSVLNFDIKKSEKAFEIPLYNVSQCTTGKNEVTVEFHQNDDAPVSLMEVRFHIPTIDGVDPVKAFMDQVLQNANIINETGECITIFKELQCLTPRGRYDIKMFPTFIQLHGKTFDYKIPISSVLRLFQLPHKDSRQVFFVMSLDPPIKQGQTRYHFLILLFGKEEEVTIDISLPESEIKEKYEGKLTKTMSGPLYEIISKIMRLMVQRKITMPDPSFSKDVPVISCSYRASNGYMYPLDRGFIYLHKPPIHIRFDEVQSINFARSGGSTRSFDFEIETKSGIVHTFSSIDKEEYSKLFDFVSLKNLRVKNRGTESLDKIKDDDIVDSDIDDDEPDAYLQRVREEGRIRDEVGDDSDESDDDFNPEGEDDDVAEEFDSNASSSEGSDDDGSDSGAERRKKKHKEKKHKKSHSGGEKKKRSSKKKNKDDNKPKRPMSAFFLWMNEMREQIKKDNPSLSLTEVSKKAGDMWKDVKDKSKWEELNLKAKKVYEKEMAEYKASGGGVGGGSSDKPKKSPKKSSDSNKKSSSSQKSPTKSSGQFKSKEYLSSDDSSADSDQDSDEDDEASKKKKKKQGNGKDIKKDNKSSGKDKKSSPPPKSSKKSKKKEASSDEESEDVSMKSDDDDEEILSSPEASSDESD